MKIFTSYFANLKNIPPDIIPISICGKAPENYNGIQYKVLAPKYGFFMEWKKNQDNEFYIQHFNSEVLASLKPQDIYDNFIRVSRGKDVVLICYEKPGDFCHRHLVADWLSKNLNIEVLEYKA